MSEDLHQEVICQINKAQTELKIRLEQVLKLRLDCLGMQMDLLKLYKPQCLEILEMLRNVSTPLQEPYDINSDNSSELHDTDEGNEVLRANEDVPRKFTE